MAEALKKKENQTQFFQAVMTKLYSLDLATSDIQILRLLISRLDLEELYVSPEVIKVDFDMDQGTIKLGHELGFHRSTIQESKRRLEDSGFIRVLKRKTGPDTYIPDYISLNREFVFKIQEWIDESQEVYFMGKLRKLTHSFDYHAKNLIQVYTDFYGIYCNDTSLFPCEVKFGISKKNFPDRNIKKLTIDSAMAIYQTFYWYVIRGNHVPREIRFFYFDSAVMHGTEFAIKTLQKLTGVKVDGFFGPVTLEAVRTHKNLKILKLNFMEHRVQNLIKKPAFKYYGSLWIKHIFKTVGM